MPKLAVQAKLAVHWRSRRDAIGKKGAVDYELLMESEIEPNHETSSPTSIASTDFFVPVPEMQPLPGAWVTIGKKGRHVSVMYTRAMASTLNPRAATFVPGYYAIKDASIEAKHVDGIMRIMHHLVSVNDSEQLMLASQFADADPVDDDLEEEPSSISSKCSEALGRSMRVREKALTLVKDAKYWRTYQQTKKLKILARDTLIASLADCGLLGEIEEGGNEISRPQPLPRRNDKGSSHGAKERRKARFASAAARCFTME